MTDDLTWTATAGTTADPPPGPPPEQPPGPPPEQPAGPPPEPDPAPSLGEHSGELPSHDPTRGRVRMSLWHLATLAQALAGGVEHGLHPVAEELAAAGMLDRGLGRQPEVSGELSDLVAAFARPDVMVSVETAGQGIVLHHGIAVRGARAWRMESWPDTDLAEYTPIDPGLLLPTVVGMVSLRGADGDPSKPGWQRQTLHLPLEVAEPALSLVATAAAADAPLVRRTVVETLRQLVPDPVERSAFAGLVTSLRSTWRVSAAVAERRASVAVVDGGLSGLWRRDLPADGGDARGHPQGSTLLRLVPVTPADVWRDLATLLP